MSTPITPATGNTFGAAKLRGSDALHQAFRTSEGIHFLCSHAQGRPSARHALFVPGAVGNCSAPVTKPTTLEAA